MTNEEKVQEIAVKWKAKGLPYNAIYDSCLEMAQWKDEQFSNYLKERIKQYAGSSAAQTCTLFCELNEIHQELFCEPALNTIPDYGL